MRFFNLDLHIGVISDIKQILEELGHQVTNWSISAHAWVLGQQNDKVEIVNQQTWRSIDRAMCDAFYARYKEELEPFDAFIVTHTPCFSMLYERWNKPILCVASTRYEAPFSNDPDRWQKFNDYLRRKIDDGIVVPIANNKYDADYAELFTQRKWQVIPSICAYTGAKYTGALQDSLYYSKAKVPISIPGLLNKQEHFKHGLLARAAHKFGIQIGRRGYSWQDLATFRSIVVMPYNASIMSIFEMYAAGIPLLFPSLAFAKRLFKDHKYKGVFSELSFNQIKGLPSGSLIPCASPDPNDYENDQGMAHWIEKSDFYDSDNLKHLVYFDSFEEIEDILRSIDPEGIHHKMAQHSVERSARTYQLWKSALQATFRYVGVEAS